MTGTLPLVPSALRWVAMAGSFTLLALLYPELTDPYLVAIVAIVALVVDLRLPFSLRNYYILYCVALFGIGNRVVLGDAHSFNLDLFAYLVTFLAGYQLFTVAYGGARASSDGDRLALLEEIDRMEQVPARLERALWVLGGLQAVRLVGFISAFGMRNFYSGQELVDRFRDFGTYRNTSQATVNILLTVVATAIVALYCETSLRAGRRIDYRLLGVVLLLLPALSLQRSVLVYHSILFVSVYACDGRFRRRQVGSLPSRRRPSRARVFGAALVLLGGALVAVKVGDIRTKEFYRQSGSTAGTSGTLSAVLRSELTPIVFYRDVKENIGELEYRYGKNVVGALVTRFVPRTLWPDKPITSQELYMRRMHPSQLARGFSLAPSLFGVGFMNFGLLGCALLVGLFGFLAARYDQAYVGMNQNMVSQFLIVSSWAYSLLRDDLATSLASVLVTFVAYQVLRRALSGNRLRRRPPVPLSAPM